ncbi:MAG TPA: dephospho-CoA kinase [Vicinamibacteria bacterium]|nr:dephospho-CoA kinase [Vicinamibacteria bacterium]
MWHVGLTGGIACGKSQVRRALAARGLAVLDLDALAHAAMAAGSEAHREVLEAFGAGVLGHDGEVDRRALGAIVFADAGARERLERIVHPRVRSEEARRLRELAAAGHPLVVSEAALLVEAGAHLRFDRLVVVACSPEEQLRRLVRRDALPEAAARARIEAQMPIGEKRRYAHLVIDTDGTPAATDVAADRLADELLQLSARPRAVRPPTAEAVAGALSCGTTPGPRALSPLLLLREALGAGAIDLAGLSRLLEPPALAAWYRTARPGEGGPLPEALAAALALWAAARDRDRDWLAAAAASLARLTHDEPEAVAGAVLAAMAAAAVAGGEGPGTLPDRLPLWVPLARRWGGAAPPQRVGQAVAAAAAWAFDCRQARQASAAQGACPALAGALVGLARGLPLEGAAAGVAPLARRLSAVGDNYINE